MAVVGTPWGEYEVPLPTRPREPTPPGRLRWEAGAFLATYITHFEYVSRSGKVPSIIVKRIEEAGYELKVVPE